MRGRKHIEEIARRFGDGRPDWTIAESWRGSVSHSINAALAAADEGPWRSMDSAPKDEWVIVCEDGDRCIAIGRAGVFTPAFAWLDVVVWLDDGSPARCVEPTQWMHLPAAPGGETAEVDN